MVKNRVADLAYWTPDVAILGSFCGRELRKCCLGVFLTLAYFFGLFRTSKISTFSNINICSSASVLTRDLKVIDVVYESTPLGPDPTKVAAIAFRYI